VKVSPCWHRGGVPRKIGVVRHGRIAACFVLAFALACAVPRARAQAPSLEGEWTLNKEQSDQPPAGAEGREGREGRDGREGGHRGQGGHGGGGRGGFSGPGFGGGRGETVNSEDAQRLRNALRDELNPPDHLSIVESGSTIILTARDGRTTRLSADGKKIKDDNTSVERRTRRDGAKVVSEISGLGQGKITETYTVDAERKQLRVTLAVDGPQRKGTFTRVYDADPR